MLYFDRIKEICILFGSSVEELSEGTGISINTMKKWNTVEPKIGNFIAIANFYNITIDFLVGNAVIPNPNSQSQSVIEFAKKLSKLSDAAKEVIIPIDSYIACIDESTHK